MSSKLFLLVFLSVAYGERPTSCRQGWLHGTGSCYLIVKDDQSWADARSVCDFMGAKLVKIETADEDNLLKSHLTSTYPSNVLDASNGQPLQFWTAGNQFQQRGTWMWSKDEALSHTGWGQNYPDAVTANQNCLVLDEKLGYAWRNNNCATDRNFICEIELAQDPAFG